MLAKNCTLLLYLYAGLPLLLFNLGYISTEAYCEDTTHLDAQYTWLQKDLVSVTTRYTNPGFYTIFVTYFLPQRRKALDSSVWSPSNLH